MCLRFIGKITRFKSNSESGNVFLGIFGAIALVGLLGASIMTFMKGPLSTSVRLTKMNTAENQMQIGSQVAVMATASQANNGDCDADGYVEPIEWRAPAVVTDPHPINGGLVPLSLGISKKDPWGTEYGYCVWNHGLATSGNGCNANMLAGAATHAYPVVALISAGPDKIFTTTCLDFATADTNSNGVLTDAGDLPLVSKAAETDDDVITSYTYEEATGASGGLWNIKAGDPTTAVIGKNIESSGIVSSGIADLKGGVLLPDKSLIDCTDVTNAGVMAKSAGGIEICDGAGVWNTIGGGGSTKLEDDTVQTDAMCDGTAVGQLRYKTSTAPATPAGVTFKGVNSVNLPGDGSKTLMTLTIPVPAGTAAGDLILYAVSDDGCQTITWPPGFTQLYYNILPSPDYQCVGMAYKVATGSETNLSYSDSESYAMSGSVIVYSGVDTTAPINSSSWAGSTSTSGPWAMNSNSLTTTAADAMLVWFGSSDTDSAASGFNGSNCTVKTTTYTPPSGFTKRVDIQGTADAYSCFNPMALADSIQATAGATGVLTGGMTSTGGGDASTGTMVVALKPAASGGGGGTPTKSVEVCDGTNWTDVADGTSTSTGAIKLENQTVNTDLMCDATEIGLMRYNTAGTSTTQSVSGGGGGGVAPALVQQTPMVVHVPTQNFSTAPTIGNSVIVLVTGGGDGTTACDINGSTTLTDNYGNTYTKTIATTEPNVWADNAGIWIAPVVNTGSGFTVTFANSTCTAWNTIQLVEVSGIDNSSPVDVTAEAFGPDGYAHVQTLTTPSTTSSNAIAIGVYDHPGGFSTMSISPGWSLIPGGDTSGATYNVYQVLSSTGIVSNTWTSDTDTRSPIAITVFKGSGGGGSTIVSGSTYAEVCNGTNWVTVGHGFLDNLNDAIANYTGTASSGNQSTYSMFFGKDVGITATAGAANNTAIGVGSTKSLTTGSANTALGKNSLAANTTGGNNTAIGYQTLSSNTSAGSNTAVGYQALKLSDGGQHNVAIGSDALASNIYYDYNVAVGDSALTSSTDRENTAVGGNALAGTTTGRSNTALGYDAGNAGTPNTTGNYNTFIGYQAQADANNYTNSTALGNGAIITASNRIVLGNTAIAQIRAQVTSITAISDKRLKKDIEDSELGLFFIDSLRPVQYRYNNGDNTLRYGFIAQETESVLPDNLKPLVGKESGLALVNHDNDKAQTYHMTYGELTAPIVKAIQELSAKLTDFMIKTKETLSGIFDHNKEQDAEIKALRTEIDRLKLSCDKK